MGKYESLAKDIIANVGGKENVLGLTHCVTRLRFTLKDESIANTDVLKNMDGVVTVMKAGGQYQVVIGNHVPDVFKDVCAVAGIQGDAKGEGKKMSASEKVFDMITGIFMPSIGILCASGILKGVNTILDMTAIVPAAGGLGQLLAAAADAMFLFFPVILGYNTFKKLGGNPFLGMTLGAALCYPAIQNVELSVLGITVTAGYQSTVLPIILLSFVAVPFEKLLNKIVPDVVKTFVTPAVVLGVMLPVGFCIIGPAANALSNAINAFLNGAYAFSPIIAGALMGGLWQILVMFGVHSAVIMTIIVGLMMGTPQPLMAAMGCCSFVQTGAVIAIWLKTKNQKLKDVALPAWISGIFGVTEPAIYGVTLAHGYQFWLTCAISALFGGISAVLGLACYTMAGMGVFSLPGMINPANAGGSLIMGALYLLASTVAGFVGAFLTFKDEDGTVKESARKESVSELKVKKEELASPLTGKLLPLSEVKDEAFSGELLGKGFAVDPTDGNVYAPCDGTVMTLFPTLHAVGIVSNNGAEVLVHIGLDTVQLNGEHFKAHVAQGDKVTKGQLLITVDIDAVKAAGFSVVTPVIITNTADYLDVVTTKEGNVNSKEDVLTVII